MFRSQTSHLCILGLIIFLRVRRTHQENPLQCGIPQISKTELIVQGEDTAPGAWPWHVAIYHRKGRSDNYACGGTLISEQFVLTAAHCTINPQNRYQLANSRIFVRLGVHNLNVLNTQSLQQHEIYKIHKPNNFTGLDFRNDIAILELNTLARFNDYVQPACVSISDSLTGQQGTVIGWGVTEDDVISPILKSTGMPVIDSITCLTSNRAVFGKTLDRGIFCAGFLNGTNVCNGDSGGGIFFQVDNAWYLGGIVSYSQKRDDNSNLCQTNSFGAFTNVRAYLSWISSVTNLTFHKVDDILTEDDLRSDFGRCEAKEADPSTVYPNLLPRNCGSYTPNRIIRGSKADVFEFAWMAIVKYNVDPGKEFDNFCTGTLINKRYVLTSAHCVKSSKMPIKVRLGEHTIGEDRDCNGEGADKECAPPVRDYGIECIIRHQKYSPRSRLHNIALIRLDRDVQFDDHIQPICLPVTESLMSHSPEKYIVSGWGVTEQDRHSKVLLKAVVIPAERSSCQSWMDVAGWKLDASQLCVGEVDGADACRGDGGGPLGYSARLNGLRFVQFGIVSYGSGCGVLPSIYTNVAYYMPWIRANMKP
uniref:Putative trypsin-like serine protease n=1 Tax=Aedes aegypti TaxID=7159 RepID=A0A0P6JRT7_AEDAE